MSDISIYVATHKEVNLTLPDIYKICQVNAEKNGKWKGQYVHDNDGEDNISIKNTSYSELTALYELWKNDNSKIKGLCHYRRFFDRNYKITKRNFIQRIANRKHLKNKVMDAETIEYILKDFDLILEYPMSPHIVNVREDLQRFVFLKDIEIMDNVFEEYYPEYLNSYKQVMNATYISYLNMLITSNRILNNYCEWLFGVLEKIENKANLEGYDQQHTRLFGYLSEVLLNVYVIQHELKLKHTFVIMPEDDNLSIYSRIKKIAKKILVNYTFSKNSNNEEIYREIQNTGMTVPINDTLEKKYSGEPSINKLKDYYRHVEGSKIEIEREINIDVEKYIICLLYHSSNDYSYKQSNGRCIGILQTESIEELLLFKESITDRYGMDYTINTRVISNNPQIKEYCRKKTDIYFYN